MPTQNRVARQWFLSRNRRDRCVRSGLRQSGPGGEHVLSASVTLSRRTKHHTEGNEMTTNRINTKLAAAVKISTISAIASILGRYGLVVGRVTGVSPSDGLRERVDDRRCQRHVHLGHPQEHIGGVAAPLHAGALPGPAGSPTPSSCHVLSIGESRSIVPLFSGLAVAQVVALGKPARGHIDG
jgi:hypothetical protein